MRATLAFVALLMMSSCSSQDAETLTVYRFQPTDYPDGIGISSSLSVEETKGGLQSRVNQHPRSHQSGSRTYDGRRTAVQRSMRDCSES
jgi:hypothetical protein